MSEQHEVEKRKRPLSLQAMIKRLSLASEDSIQFLIDKMNDEEADVKDRISCAKFLLSQHASLLSQAEREAMNRQSSIMNNYKIKREQRLLEEEANLPANVKSVYSSVTAISTDIVYNPEEDDK